MTNIIEAIERELQRLKDEISIKNYEIDNLKSQVVVLHAENEMLKKGE